MTIARSALPRFAAEDAPAPLFSVVIPARDEAAQLPHCLHSIQRSLAECRSVTSSVDLEVIVVLNRCTDGTEAIAREAGCRVTVENGKNLALIRNAGVRIARGTNIITIDADSLMSEQMVRRVCAALERSDVVGGGVMIVPERWSAGILATGLLLLPIAFWYGISGGLFFCRKTDFDAIGGFDVTLASVEDIDFARRLKAHGRLTGRKFIHLFRARIVTSCRKFDRFGDWYFVLRPWLTWSLLKGRNQAAADKVWYDFKR